MGPALALSRTGRSDRHWGEEATGDSPPDARPLGPFSERSLRGQGLLAGDQKPHEVLLYHVAQHPVEDLLRSGPTKLSCIFFTLLVLE